MDTHSATDNQVLPRRHGQQWRRHWLPLGAALAVALVIIVGLRLWAVGQRLQALVAEVHALEALAQNPERLVSDGAASLADARATLGALRADLWPLPAITAHMGWVPGYGSDLAAVGPLLEAGDRTLVATESLLRAGAPLAPVLQSLDRVTLADPAFAVQLAAIRPALERAQAEADQAIIAWTVIDTSRLSPAIGPSATQARALAALLPGLTSLGVATIDAHAALSPLLPYLEDDDAVGRLIAGDSAAARDIARLAAGLPRARSSAEHAEAAWAATSIDSLPEGQRARLRQLAALPALYLALISTAEAADGAFATLGPILTQREPGQPLGAAVAAGLMNRGDELVGLRLRLDHVAMVWARVPLEQLPPALRQGLEPLPEQIEAARDMLDLAGLLPTLLGAEERQDYLVLAQSGDELRPGGGFITSVGTLSLQGGRVLTMQMQDSGRSDLGPISAPSPYAPEPLGRYMEIYRWVLRDANWSPDFPETARMAGDLYAISGRAAPPNVVAIDMLALQELLRCVGPVALAGEAEPVGAETVVAYFERQHDLHGSDNEGAVTPLVEVLLERVEGGDIEVVGLLRTVRQLLDRRHIQIAVAESTASDLFARLGWDGAVRPGAQDFLMVVDANVGYTKSNRSIEQALSYTVDLNDPSAPVATLAISYTHTAPPTASCADLDADPPSYSSMTVRCHRDYLRVLAPKASYLLGAENAPSAGAWTWSGIPDSGQVTSEIGEAGARVFATYFALPQGEQRTLTLRYSLPETVVVNEGGVYHYRLRVQKQAGREPMPLRISLGLPPGAQVIGATHTFDQGGATTLELKTTLVHDEELEVRFQIP